MAEWEACIVPPSGVRTMMRLCNGFLLEQLVLEQIKRLVHPESAHPTWEGLDFKVIGVVDENKL